MNNVPGPHYRLPNLFVPGAQKSGTASLHRYLSQHPQCAMSQPKEPCIFSNAARTYDLTQYSSYFPQSRSSDVRVFGDGSTNNLTDPEVPHRIFAALGDDLRFIFLLRNPMERTISAYWHMFKRLHERRPMTRAITMDASSLDEAIRLEDEAMGAAEARQDIEVASYRKRYIDPRWNYRYLRNSSYLNDLQRYEHIFGRERMLVVFSEDLRSNRIVAFRRIAEFLEIDPSFVPENLGREYNKTVIPRRDPASRFIRQVSPWLQRVELGVVRQWIQLATIRQKPRTDSQIRRRLNELFASHNHNLSEYLGVNTDTFWKD